MVFPAPFGPRSATNSPDRREKLTFPQQLPASGVHAQVAGLQLSHAGQPCGALLRTAIQTNTRRPEQRGHHSQFQLGGGGSEPDGGVGQRQDDPGEERRRQQAARRVVADQGPRQVRGHDADEADDPGEGDRRAGGEPGADDHEQSVPPQVEPHPGGGLLAEGERGEAAPGRKEQREPRGEEGGGEQQVVEAAIRHGAEHPLHHVGQGKTDSGPGS